jgi:hypothetical protein
MQVVKQKGDTKGYLSAISIVEELTLTIDHDAKYGSFVDPDAFSTHSPYGAVISAMTGT